MGNSIIGAAIDLGSQVAGGFMNFNQAAKNRAFQERMYYQQLADNRANWNLMNQYDLPSAQVQRLRDANLNPLIMYSNGASGIVATSPANGASMPSGAQGSTQLNTQFAKAMYDQQRVKAEVDLLKSQRDDAAASAALKSAQAISETFRPGLMKSERYLNRSSAVYNKSKTKGQDFENKFASESFKARLYGVYYDNLKTQAETRLSNQLSKTEVSKRELLSAEVAKTNKQIDDIDNQIKNRDKLTNAQVAEIKQNIENSIKVTAYTIAKLDADARKAEAEAVAIEIDNFVKTQNYNEYERDMILKWRADVYKAICEGNASQIETVYKSYILSTFPERGSTGHEVLKWWNSYGDLVRCGSGILGAAILKF